MKESLQLIVLGTTKFSDSGLVLHSLSREYGRRGFLVRVGKKTPLGTIMPLSLIEAEISSNPKSDLWSAKNLSERTPLPGIRGDIRKNSMTLFMAEVLMRAVRDGMNEDGLYEWAEGSILTLNALQGHFPNYPLRFLLDFAGALGFRPSFDSMLPFAGSNLKAMKALLESEFQESLLIPLKGEERNALCEEIIRYLEYHLESSLNIRSLAVLRELFAEGSNSPSK